jgi:cellulose 1,4-beta-cellobiosidase
MKSFISLIPLLAHSAAAGVIQARASATDSNAAVTAAPAAASSGNPFSGYQLYANSYYSSEVYASAIPSMTGAAQAAASSAAVVPSFFWLYALQPFTIEMPPAHALC